MWEISVADQTVTFLYSVLLGVIFCLLYDMFRSVRHVHAFSFSGVFFQDILFWTLSAFITFCFLLGRTNGSLRGYVLLGILLGFIAARFTVSLIFFPLLSRIFGITVRLYSAFRGALSRLNNGLSAFLRKNMPKFAVPFKKIIKFIKKLLKHSG